MKLLNTYRGAGIYEVSPAKDSEVQTVGCKVKAEGLLPEPKNMKVDFIEVAANQKEAVKAVKEKIDWYLDEHGVREFSFEHPEH